MDTRLRSAGRVFPRGKGSGPKLMAMAVPTAVAMAMAVAMGMAVAMAVATAMAVAITFWLLLFFRHVPTQISQRMMGVEARNGYLAASRHATTSPSHW